jgi:FAD/FMN-containing dehydrogenases
MRMSELPADFVQQLHTLLGADLHRDSASLQAQAGDNSWREQRPALVACPRNLEQVQAVVRLCHAWRVPLVARGAGTGTTGAAVPTPGSVALVMTRMDRILAINPADRCAVVQPGVLNGSLQQALRPHGLFWAPDPSSFESCSIGGNLATNAGGPRAVRYGTTATTCSG